MATEEASTEYESGPAVDGLAPPPLPSAEMTNSTHPLPTVAPEALAEFTLAIKPKGTPAFKLIALYKSRLRFSIFLHFVLFMGMLIKLSEDILDRMDIFILELEELYVPKPLMWEWIWACCILLSFLGLRAASTNRLSIMNYYVGGMIIFGIFPLFFPGIYYFNDIWQYADLKSEAEIEKWQGYPVCVIWYVFILIALQVHVFSLYFAFKLIKMWRAKTRKG